MGRLAELFVEFKKIDWKKYRHSIRRWHVEMFLLSILLFPIIAFVFWIQQDTTMILGPQITAKAVFAMAVGVISLAIWVLGISVIIVNLLREILIEIIDFKKSQRDENKQ
ncbi:MAG: hypothetical protein A2504_12825 [Bdellovibrionales bacterium RIFOXYD12_FULL_39_22]|nr:MAG: hypothetical protein A2385_03910 [Bdellovibrionales bacterium RIFOXYB1_FULL_39_21]OFZ40498.1 MAG: hypothetical protein A2485_02775 [Bdellovibrionales bacterium RIFOXYC12_FULL_39_17]OFZ49981.1 MAG: hypothetical protein A2404_02110 [Bdellovibrionales bacterium RIFOXYC1_FULL_39_130]OFZ77623.1 MAG: hypothetical protein A2560_04670 [Bdellovibrionales bacterium RIFOXYD1_FULL_39_84]OFZ96077.1 MAG: hypothetical protein A2504_12825 [Bdellovibrionales bacterium RIFOXYD12_FULL_39_22]HLE10634.1 hy